MFKKYSVIVVLAMLVTGCQPSDPSSKDLKSPCVSNDLDAKSPCVRRDPIAQSLIV